jgi:hypothetical protein
MRTALQYYWNPLLLSIGVAAYFIPFMFAIEPGHTSGRIAALFMLPFVSILWAWLVALIQVVMGVIGYRRNRPHWRHHLFSAAWTYACYIVWLILINLGFLLAA